MCLILANCNTATYKRSVHNSWFDLGCLYILDKSHPNRPISVWVSPDIYCLGKEGSDILNFTMSDPLFPQQISLF